MAVSRTAVVATASRFMRYGLAAATMLVLAVMASARAASPDHVAGDADWIEQKVFDSAGAGYDHFGTGVAISGTTAFIAAPEVTIDGHSSQGRVYVYDQAADGTWTQTQMLTASDGAEFNEFGWAIALSGDTAVISAINAKIGDNISQGAAYVFKRADDGTWSETQKLVASDGHAVDWFGNAVALSDDTIVVAAYGSHYNDQAMRGEVYVFADVGGTWTETQQLVASDGASGDQLGLSVAISGSTVLASAPGARIDDRYAQGAVYAFANVGGVWSETQKLVADDGVESDQLGTSIAIDGDTALIGAMWYHGGHGAVYVFNRAGDTWSQAQRLGASDGVDGIDGIGLPDSDNFGMTIALHGGTALVGADNITVGDNQGQGVVYQFQNTGGSWTGSHTFDASDGVALDYFGSAVAFDGANVLIGAFGYTPDFDHYQQGSAYFFRHVVTGIPASERAALIDLYNSTNGAGWWDMTGWIGEPGTECSWTGVTCDDSGTTVIGLAFDLTNMIGTLPPSLTALTNLVSLQISDQSGLTGEIPPLTGLAQLQSINLGYNALTGPLPSLAGLSNLQSAIFSGNQLTGEIPSLEGLGSLQWFAASGNQLSGHLPPLDGLDALTGFYVDYNQLTGALPTPPASLGQYGAALCPNYFDAIESAEWDFITGIMPWYQDCTTPLPDAVFSNGFDGDTP